MAKINAIHFGAGNIGRGLIAQIYQKNNIQFAFIDTNQQLVEKLNNSKSYNIIDIETKQKITINNFKTLWSNDEKEVLKALQKTNIISTSIGSNNLIHLKIILDKLYELDSSPKIIICFENGFKISDYFKNLLKPKNNWIFINASTDRIIPILAEKNLNVQAESFYEIVLEKNDAQKFLKLKDVIYTKHLESYILRKLLMVNALHSGIGYLGFILGQKYIHQSMKLENVKKYIQKMIDIIIEILLKQEANFSKQELKEYAQKIINRLQNPYLKDLVVRVARNPLTKIAKNERYDLLLQKAKIHNLSKEKLKIIYQNFVNILLFDYPQDQQSQTMQHLISSNLQSFLKKHANLNFEEIKIIEQMYKNQIRKKAQINE